jgi:hypothetical protein
MASTATTEVIRRLLRFDTSGQVFWASLASRHFGVTAMLSRLNGKFPRRTSSSGTQLSPKRETTFA